MDESEPRRLPASSTASVSATFAVILIARVVSSFAPYQNEHPRSAATRVGFLSPWRHESGCQSSSLEGSPGYDAGSLRTDIDTLPLLRKTAPTGTSSRKAIRRCLAPALGPTPKDIPYTMPD